MSERKPTEKQMRRRIWTNTAGCDCPSDVPRNERCSARFQVGAAVMTNEALRARITAWIHDKGPYISAADVRDYVLAHRAEERAATYESAAKACELVALGVHVTPWTKAVAECVRTIRELPYLEGQGDD